MKYTDDIEEISNDKHSVVVFQSPFFQNLEAEEKTSSLFYMNGLGATPRIPSCPILFSFAIPFNINNFYGNTGRDRKRGVLSASPNLRRYFCSTFHPSLSLSGCNGRAGCTLMSSLFYKKISRPGCILPSLLDLRWSG